MASKIKVEWDAAVVNRLLEEDASKGLHLLSQLLYWQEEERAQIYVGRKAFLALIDKVFFKFIGDDTAVAALDGFLQKWENSTEPDILVPKNLVSKESLEHAYKERAQEGPQEQGLVNNIIVTAGIVVVLKGVHIETEGVKIGPIGIGNAKIENVEIAKFSISINGLLDRLLPQGPPK